MYPILRQRMAIFHAGAVWNETTAAVKSAASRSQAPSNTSVFALAVMVTLMVILWSSGISWGMNEEGEERRNESDDSESSFGIPSFIASEDKVREEENGDDQETTINSIG